MKTFIKTMKRNLKTITPRQRTISKYIQADLEKHRT